MKSLERAGHFLSVVLHPAVTMFLTAFLLSSYARENLALALVDVGILVAGIFPGPIYILVKSRRGDFTHYQLLLKEERHTVFPILLAGLIGSFAVYAVIHAPASLMRGMLIGIIGGVGGCGHQPLLEGEHARRGCDGLCGVIRPDLLADHVGHHGAGHRGRRCAVVG